MVGQKRFKPANNRPVNVYQSRGRISVRKQTLKEFRKEKFEDLQNNHNEINKATKKLNQLINLRDEIFKNSNVYTRRNLPSQIREQRKYIGELNKKRLKIQMR